MELLQFNYVWYPVANYSTLYKYRATNPRVRELISLKDKYYARTENHKY